MAGVRWPVPTSQKYKARPLYFCLRCITEVPPNPERNKNGNRKPTVCKQCGERAHHFPSQLEYRRYRELRKLEAFGDISDLELQPRYPIKIKNPHGKNILVTTYVADFRYKEKDGTEVVEDTKGFKTKLYTLKKKLVLAVYGIEIKES